MVRTPEQVSQDIITHLRLIDPDMSAFIGSPERKIIDAVSAVVSASYINSQLTSSIWDIDTKAGVELEEICGLFGFGRREGAAATGVLTFELQQPAPTDYAIPVGTLASTVASTVSPSIQYRTVQAGIISAGERFAEVAAECIDMGTVGNTTAHTVVILESWSAVAAVYNQVAFTGGVDSESDDELRQRFKETFLRNLAGTEDYYAALCLSHRNVSKVRVVGPVERNVEQVQAVVDEQDRLIVASDISYSKFQWPRSVILSANDGLEDERWFREGVAFTVDSTQVKPLLVCTRVDRDADETGEFVHEGDIVTLEHEYTPVSSRNDPAAGVTNKVDVFVNGAEGTVVNERTVVSLVDVAALDDTVLVDDYGDTHTEGWLLPLSYGPVVAGPVTLTVGEAEYRARTASEAGDYVLVRQSGTLAGSSSATTGLLFTGGRRPDDGALVTVSYSYNRVPMLLDALLAENRQITTDVMVHEADIVPLGVSIVVQVSRGYSPSGVRDEVERELTDWAAGLGFGAWIQLSDLHTVVRRVEGVDNARVKTRADTGPEGYGVAVYTRSGTSIATVHEGDFRLADNQLAALHTLNMVVRAENTFGGS